MIFTFQSHIRVNLNAPDRLGFRTCYSRDEKFERALKDVWKKSGFITACMVARTLSTRCKKATSQIISKERKRGR